MISTAYPNAPTRPNLASVWKKRSSRISRCLESRLGELPLTGFKKTLASTRFCRFLLFVKGCIGQKRTLANDRFRPKAALRGGLLTAKSSRPLTSTSAPQKTFVPEMNNPYPPVNLSVRFFFCEPDGCGHMLYSVGFVPIIHACNSFLSWCRLRCSD